jgi:hypothetical protein
MKTQDEIREHEIQQAEEYLDGLGVWRGHNLRHRIEQALKDRVKLSPENYAALLLTAEAMNQTPEQILNEIVSERLLRESAKGEKE